MNVIDLKRELHQHCIRIVEGRIEVAHSAMEVAQQAANSEEKSTAGDKYDTARAMGHIDRDMNARQLSEALDTLDLLNRVDFNSIYQTVQPGAVVITTLGNYYIAVSAGSFNIAGKSYFTVSPGSPIAQALTGKKKEDVISFNNKELKVIEVD